MTVLRYRLALWLWPEVFMERDAARNAAAKWHAMYEWQQGGITVPTGVSGTATIQLRRRHP